MFGGNVDNWRFGPGATIHYPVFHEGAGLYVGDPALRPGRRRDLRHGDRGLARRHAAGLSIAEDVGVDLAAAARPTSHWFTHGFGDDLDAAMRMAAEQALRLLVDRGGFTRRRGLLAGVGGGRLRRHAGRRRQARLPRRDRPARCSSRKAEPVRITPHEQERLLIHVAADVARARQRARAAAEPPEAVAILTDWVLEALATGARSPT